MNLPHLKSGDILICKGKRALSKAIGRVSKSEATHTASIIEINGETMVFEAQKRGAYPIRFDNWQHIYDYDFIVFRPDGLPKNYSKRVNAYSGLKYDKKLLLFGFFRKLWFGKTVRDKNNGDGQVVCSELTMKCCTNVIDPENYTPGDVLNYCMRNGFKVIEIKGKWDILRDFQAK